MDIALGGLYSEDADFYERLGIDPPASGLQEVHHLR
jgi:hypothetical protein